MADHVVRGPPEVGRQSLDVAGVRLQVPAGPVQQDQVGSATRAKYPGPHTADVDVEQFVVDVGEFAPDADVFGELGHGFSIRARASLTGGAGAIATPV